MQEVQVGSVDGETLSPELITQVVLIQFGELLLELKGRKQGLGTRRESPRGPAHHALSLESVSHWILLMGQTEVRILFSFFSAIQSDLKEVINKGLLPYHLVD